MRKTCIIPARGGSRRLPRKNIMPFRGIPMIGHSIMAAFRSRIFERILVSTDDEEIERIALGYGVGVHHRTPEMARDEVGTKAVITNVIQELAIGGLVCCLYPCAPTVAPDDLIAAHNRWLGAERRGFLISTYPDWLQDAGAFYFASDNGWKRKRMYTASTIIFPLQYACDINTAEDLAIAERLFDERFRA